MKWMVKVLNHQMRASTQKADLTKSLLAADRNVYYEVSGRIEFHELARP